MAGRIRSIKPEILEDERSAGLSSDAWRLWVSMWLIADDFGRVRGEPRRLAASIFWSCPHEVRIADALDELEAAGSIKRYRVRGQQYIEIQNWSKHQRIDNASRLNKLPGPDEAEPEDLAAVRGDSRRMAAVRGSDLDLERKGEGREKDNNLPDSADAASGSVVGVQEGLLGLNAVEPSPKFDFEAAYALYPRKEGKKKGLQRCSSQIRTRAKYDALVTAVKNYAAHVAGREPDKIKQFDTFMGCWEEYVTPPAGNGARAIGHAKAGPPNAVTRDATDDF